jgi:hypothetical protein
VSLIVHGTSADLRHAAQVAGVAANWMVESMRLAGLDPDSLPVPTGSGRTYAHLPPSARPWKTVWSAGQGIDLIDDVPPVADLVARLRAEYVAACRVPDMAEVAAASPAHDAQPVGAMTGEVAGSLGADAEVITRFPPVDANRPELAVWLYRTGTRRATPTDRRTP